MTSVGCHDDSLLLEEDALGTQSGKGPAYFTYGICHALDMMHVGDWGRAEGLLYPLVAAMEAVCFDHGRWHMAWLFTFLPEPPWAQMAAAPAWDAIRPFCVLAPVVMTTAATHYLKDAAALGELRKATGCRPKGNEHDGGGGGAAGGEGAPAKGARKR